MAPTRKSRSVNKRFSYLNEVSPDKDGDNANKSRQRKRKLSDMLGPQWSKEELERFYEAYRKHGKDWKKVASVVRNRSVEMVEALYTMNRAYLSLPEGTASVVGLIAMMTDHYSVLEVSDSEQESNDGAGSSRKPQKRGRGKVRLNVSKGSEGHFPDLAQSQSAPSNHGCLSLLKKRRSSGSRPRAVGKRTPRFPVSYLYDKDNREKYLSPNRQGLKLKPDSNDDDDVAHEVALALAEASHRGGSPQVSQTPNRRKETAVSSPLLVGDRMHGESEMTSAKLIGNEVDEESLGSMEADNGDYGRDGKSYLIVEEGVGTLEVQRKRKKFYEKRVESEDSGNDNNLDDIKEACSGTEEGQNLGANVKGKFETEVEERKHARSSSQGPRKRSKKVLFGVEDGSVFDALQTLADLSLMMPATTVETESPMQVKEERHDITDKNSLRDKTEGAKLKANPGKVSALGVRDVAEAKDARNRKRKQKSLPSQIPKAESCTDSHQSDQKPEAKDEGKKSTSKGKRSSQSASQPKQGKHVKAPERSSSSTDHRRETDASIVSTIPDPNSNQVNATTKLRSRRKMDPPKPMALKDLKSLENNAENEQASMSMPSLNDKALNIKEKLSNCLSSDRVRRWCIFEWFYSAIDYPWFAKREFVEYLYHVGLGHVPRLTRVEWGVIRSSLGKPRRFSEQFLKEEKEKLNQYRESVRAHYTELRAGIREGLPSDLARPLSVGQRVIALHPKTREIHDGSVLTVDHTRCRVQFDRPELGVEFVLDIDCMPLNPLENMPASLARHKFSDEKFLENFNELKMNGRSKDWKTGMYMKFARSENLENADVPCHNSTSTYSIGNLFKQAKGDSANSDSHLKVGSLETASTQEAANCQANILALQAKEGDVQALAELTRALDKKVSTALHCLRQRNTYQGNSGLQWMKPTASLGDPNSLSIEGHNQETGSHVVEIVEGSRKRARTMVDAAIQAMSSLKKGGNCIERIEEAIDYVSNRLSVEDSPIRHPTSMDTVNGSLVSQDQLNSSTSNQPVQRHAPDPDLKLNNASERSETQLPSNLITHCVSTLLMIQKCTERQFPPADVAQILDSAATSLQPCCSQNLPIYSEIQKCMGIIRNQILALIPT